MGMLVVACLAAKAAARTPELILLPGQETPETILEPEDSNTLKQLAKNKTWNTKN